MTSGLASTAPTPVIIDVDVDVDMLCIPPSTSTIWTPPPRQPLAAGREILVPASPCADRPRVGGDHEPGARVTVSEEVVARTSVGVVWVTRSHPGNDITN
jgi:hypothetical protein